MSDPPAVRLLPDGAGYLLKRRILADGREEALVSYIEITPGPRGGLVPREEWLPLDRVRPLPGVDYSAVDHEHPTEDTSAMPGTEPAGPGCHGAGPGRPAQLPPPGGDPEWMARAQAWLLDCLPPDYRAHEIVHDPYVLGQLAARHVDQALAALRVGYRTASVDLKAHLPPHVIAEVLQVYRAEGGRLTDAAAAIPVVTRALRAHHPRQ